MSIKSEKTKIVTKRGKQNAVYQTDSAPNICIENNFEEKTHNKKNIKKVDQINTFSKKNFAIEYITANKHIDLKLFSEDLGDQGAKIFIATTYEYMYHLCSTQKSPHYYENIEAGVPVKFHIDIDMKVATSKKSRLERIFNKLVEEAIYLFNEEFKKENITKPEIIILKSDNTVTDTNMSKISAHIIYNNVIFNDINDMKLFILKIKSQSKLFDNNIIDKNIYRVGCFRLLHCSKKGKTNKLRFLRGINYNYQDEKTVFFDSLVTHISKNQKVHTINVNYQINPKVRNIKLRNEKINKVNMPVIENDLFFYVFDEPELEKLSSMAKKIDIKFIDNYNYWILLTYSFIDLHNNIDEKYRKKVFNIWDDLCKKGKNYNKQNNQKYFFSLKLDHINANLIPTISNTYFRFKKIIKYTYIKPRFINYDVDRLNIRFIETNMYKKIGKYDIIALKSPPGTGKTTLLNKIFKIKKVNMKNTNNFKYPIISITSRKNLAEKHAEDLGIFNYKNNNIYLFDINKVAITVNSLIKINEKNFEGGYLILDETSKILNYLKSNILNGIRYDVYEIFCNIVMNAKKIILLDADLTENDLDTIIKIRNLKPSQGQYYLAINEYKTKTNINAYFYDNPHVVAEMLINDFINKVPFICALDSLSKMKLIMNEIKKKAIDLKIIEQIDKLIKIYSSEEEDTTFNMSELKKKLGILFTPILIYGIDINSEVPRKVYSFAFKKILTPAEINQQIQRERNQSEIHIYVNQNISYIQYMSQNELRDSVQQRINKYNDTISEITEINKIDMSNNIKKNSNIQTIFNDMYINTTFVEETTKVHMEYYLKNIMASMGYNIIDKKDKTKFKLKSDRELINTINNDIFEKFKLNGEINIKIKEKIIDRMDIMGIKKINLDDFNKNIIIFDTKFNDYLNLRRLLNNKLDDKIIENSKNELAECGSNNIYIKLREYKKISTVLGIKNNIEFNYDTDCKKFNNKILDKQILDNIDTIKKLFNIKGAKYKDFDKDGGYERLYKMTISICKQLFGNDMLNVITIDKKINKKAKKICKYYINETYMKNIKKYL